MIVGETEMLLQGKSFRDYEYPEDYFFKKRTAAEKAARKARRKAGRQKTWQGAKTVLSDLGGIRGIAESVSLLRGAFGKGGGLSPPESDYEYGLAVEEPAPVQKSGVPTGAFVALGVLAVGIATFAIARKGGVGKTAAP